MFIEAAAERGRHGGEPSDSPFIELHRGRFGLMLPRSNGLFGGELKMTFQHLSGESFQIGLEPQDQGILVRRLSAGSDHS